VVGDLRGGEAHEVARADPVLLVPYLRDAAPGEYVDPLLLPVVRVVGERLLAGRDTNPTNADPGEPDQRAQARAVELGARIPRVGEPGRGFLGFLRPDDEPVSCAILCASFWIPATDRTAYRNAPRPRHVQRRGQHGRLYLGEATRPSAGTIFLCAGSPRLVHNKAPLRRIRAIRTSENLVRAKFRKPPFHAVT
jgi:hypothetical protein